MTKVRLSLNGKTIQSDVDARTSLADFVRETMNLTATHLGCEHGICGACTVLVNDAPTRACLCLTVACEGYEVRTLEGLRDDPVILALQKSFHENHGLQCGFCTPAMLVSARDLILRGKARTDQEIRQGLSGNLCRCTGYTSIVASVRRAADALAGADGSPVPAAVEG
jgi:aerobic carbon-monoxide dehydrogenase small subunit